MFKIPRKSEQVVEKPAEPVADKVEQKKPGSEPESSTKQKTVNLDRPVVKEAIAQGKAIIKAGKSKADAARAMYALIKEEDKDVIVAAFVQGAALTEKGALTYWYNCKRRAEKESKKTASG